MTDPEPRVAAGRPERRTADAPAPELDVWRARGKTTAVVLVLPGGSGAESGPGDRYRPSVLRMLPFAWTLRRAGARRGLAVALLRYRVAGWKDGADSAAADAQWALDGLHERFGAVPVVLLGHSMGGRVALSLASAPSVLGVVALAPWIHEELRVGGLAGRRVLIAHGDRDRVTDPRASRAFAARARAAGSDVQDVEITGDGHAMLRRFGTWHRLAREGVLTMLDAALRPAGTR